MGGETMLTKKHLSFSSLIEVLSKCFRCIPEYRQTGKVRYSVHDIMMSCFACMHFQEPSLLQFQLRMEEKRHQNNLRTMFGVERIPGDATQVREVADNVDSQVLSPFFDEYFYRLQRGKHLEQYQILPGLYLTTMDGTQYFSSDSISCKGCLRTKVKKSKGEADEEEEVNCCPCDEDAGAEAELRYGHKVLQIALMHPDMKQVIPLMPEEIKNSDGKTKQDCEVNAAKRMLPKLRKAHPQLGIVMGGDDLFSRQPMIESVKAERMHYIFVAKPQSHRYMTEWLEAYPKLREKHVEIVKLKGKKKEKHIYEWMNDVPLRDGDDAVRVNYFRVMVIKEDKKGREEITYKNSWVTDLEVTEQVVETLVRAGRCKWKIENECFNTLKNQGYCIEHNYGHGEKNLCFNFYLLTLIAFAFHQVAELTDKLYQECRKKCGSKRHLWETLRSYLKTFIFATWEALLSFLLNPGKYLPDKVIKLSG